jgi:hypothetical protein
MMFADMMLGNLWEWGWKSKDEKILNITRALREAHYSPNDYKIKFSSLPSTSTTFLL